MVPNYLPQLQVFFDANKNKYDFRTWEGCGTFTEDFLLWLNDPKMGHLKKTAPQTMWNGHAIDSILYDDGTALLSDVDILIAAETANPTPSWQVRPPTYPRSYWIAATDISNPTPIPPANPVVDYKYYAGDDFWANEVGKILAADYARANRQLDYMSSVWTARTIHDATMGPEPGKILTLEESRTKHRAEWCAILGIPVV